MKFTFKLRGYGLAMISCVVALAVAEPLDAPSSCFLLAIMVSNLYGGKGPGLLSVGLSALAFDYFFLAPRFQPSIESFVYLRYAAFLAAAVLVTALIQGKRRAEESGREINAQYRTIADTAPDAIISIDESGLILFMNPAATRMFSWAASELNGQPITTLMPKFRLMNPLSGAEWIGRRKDGTEFPAEVSFGEVAGGDQSVFTGFVRDISERKRVEAALQKSELYSAKAQQLSKTGSFGWDTSTGELFWSREMFRIAGLDPAVRPSLELVSERVHPEDRASLKEVLDRASRSGEDIDFEHRLLMPDGSVKFVHVLAHAARDESGNLEHIGAAMDVTATVRAHAELRRSEAYLAEAQKLSNTGSWACSADLEMTYWSAEMYRIKGLPPGDNPPCMEEVAKFFAPESWARMLEMFETARRKKINFDGEFPMMLPDGSNRTIRVVGHPVLNPAGDIVEFFGTTIDITEQREARSALQKAFDEKRSSEDRLREIISTIPALAWSTLADGSAEFLNQRWLDYTGLPAEQALNWGWKVAIHPDDILRVLESYQEGLDSGQSFEWEARMRRFDGEFRWFLFRGSPFRDESGNLVRWYGTNTDIEDRKRAEEALRASEHNFRLIVNSIPGQVCTRTAAGELELINQPVLDYTGKTFEELKNWPAVVYQDDRAAMTDLWNRAVETGHAYDAEFRIRRADGVYRWFHTRGLPVRDTEGRIVRWYELLTDIEDRRNAEEALRVTQARLSRASQLATIGELAASIAHEVNQPLSAVVANGQACLRWLSAQPPNLAKAQEAAERIVRDGKGAGDVVRRVRALFKRDALEKVALDLNEVINEVLRVLRGETARRRVTVETDLEKDLPLVPGDRVQLQQLVLNLLLNGLEAMDTVVDRPRKLFICSKRQDTETALVEIRDYGVGIEAPDKVFEAFFTTKESGMGMGLAICRSIIDAHNGRLWACGATPGATFCFTLPLQSSAAA